MPQPISDNDTFRLTLRGLFVGTFNWKLSESPKHTDAFFHDLGERMTEIVARHHPDQLEDFVIVLALEGLLPRDFVEEVPVQEQDQ